MGYQKDSRARTKVNRKESTRKVSSRESFRPKNSSDRSKDLKRYGSSLLPKRKIREIWNSWFVSTYVLKSSLKPQEIEEALLKVTDLTSPVPSSNTDFVEPKYFRGQVGEGSFYIQQQQTGDFSTPILRGTYAESDKGSTIYLVDEYPDIARYLMGTLVGIYLIILLLIPKDYNFLPKAIGFALLIGLVVYFIRLGYISVRKQNIAKFKEAVKVSAY